MSFCTWNLRIFFPRFFYSFCQCHENDADADEVIDGYTEAASDQPCVDDLEKGMACVKHSFVVLNLSLEREQL